ncbi:MAG: DegT/DnrJ/EryC1/StrS family aminotransferase, partial [Deferrisomatales bacterium]
MSRLLSYSYRVPYCVPYWNHEVYAAISRCFASGRVVTGPDRERLAARLRARFGVSGVILCDSGRAALELGLRAVGVVPGDEVVLPSYSCAGVIEPVAAIGAVPVLADVGEDLLLTPSSVLQALTPRTRAVIVAELSGNPAQVDAIVELCRSRGVAVIDDAAQALGGCLDGHPLGTFGDAGILSFGNGKVCFGVGGGVLLLRDPDVMARAAQVPLPMPDTGKTVRRALSVLVWRRWRRWSLPARMVWWRLSPTMRSAGRLYERAAMANLQAAVAMALLETLDENISARRSRVEVYEDLLQGTPGLSLIRHRQGSACLNQPVWLEKVG